MGALDAEVAFKGGAIARSQVLTRLQKDVSKNTYETLNRIDIVRVLEPSDMVLEPFTNQMVSTLALIYKCGILLKRWFPKVVNFNVYVPRSPAPINIESCNFYSLFTLPIHS